MSYLLTFVISFLISMAMLPLILKVSHARGWYDQTGGRKIHKGNVPRLGGVGIAIAFFATLVIIYASYNPLGKLPNPGLNFWLLLAMGAGIHVLGLADDFIDLSGRFKFAVQIVIAILIICLGFSFKVIALPFVPFEIRLGVLGIPITFFWIMGILNAINLIDGMDGLAGGMVFISCATWAVLFYMQTEYLPAIVATAAAGSIFGFLFFNFPPASIFMGDSGSLFLGFVLAILPLLGSGRFEGDTGLLQAITICLIPISDTLAAILRRWQLGVSFFTADRYHIHHKLLNIGLNTRQSLAVIYALAMLSGASALSTLYLKPMISSIVMLATWVFFLVFFLVMHYFKKNKFRLPRRSRAGDAFDEGQGE